MEQEEIYKEEPSYTIESSSLEAVYTLADGSIINEEIPLEDTDRKGKSWGKNILQDPTNSGVGEKIHEMLSNRPSTREWKKLADWKVELLDLYKQYNTLVGFKAFGEDEIE